MIERTEHATMLAYFHEEKGDMTRYVDFETAIELFPHIKRAKADADYYVKILDALMKEIDNE